MSKTLKECLDSSSNSFILHHLTFVYPELLQDIEEYAKVLDTLRMIPPSKSQEDYMQGMYLVVQEYDNPPFLVSGQNGKTQKEWNRVTGEFINEDMLTDDLECFGLDMNPWSEWLGLPISEESLAKYGETTIVAHCLVEMCRSGFTEEEIQSYRQSLREELESREAVEGPFLSTEEVFDRIKKKFGML